MPCSGFERYVLATLSLHQYITLQHKALSWLTSLALWS